MSIPRSCFVPLIESVLTGVKKATCFISEREVVKATFQGKRDRRARQRTIIITVGAPNYDERQFLKRAKKNKVKFPVQISKMA